MSTRSLPYNSQYWLFPPEAAQDCAASPETAVFYMQNRPGIEDIKLTMGAYIPAWQDQVGTSLDVVPPEPAPQPCISAENLRTLRDLLVSLTHDETCKSALPMLKTTVNKLVDWLKRPAEDIQIAEVGDLIPEFKLHLGRSRHEPRTVRSYVNFAQMLVRKAKRWGWREADPELEASWQPIWHARPKKPSCSGLIRYAIRHRIRPEVFGDADLNRWEAEVLAQRKMTASHASHIKTAFRSFVFRAGYATALIDHTRSGGRQYAIPFGELPQRLQAQIVAFMEYKEAKSYRGRPEKCRQRPITSRQMRDLICRIAGFLRLKSCEEGSAFQEAKTLEDIVSRNTLEEFMEWQINERGNQGTALATWLGILLNSARRFRSFSHLDFSWIPDFLQDIPTKGDELKKEEKKQRKWISYEQLCAIPEKIHVERMLLTKCTPRRLALLVRNELLSAFVTQLPWRERNLIECEVAPRGEGGNLFKERLPEPSSKARPHWVEQALRENPQETFWQYRFKPEETKANNERAVEAIMPSTLIPLLEEYLRDHRPILVRDADTRTLFVNCYGGTLSPEGMYSIIGNLSAAYAGRKINPQLIRDIVTTGWLEDHPGDYTTPSKLLWHKSPRMLEKVYGKNFDESYAGKNVEEWHEKRRKR